MQEEQDQHNSSSSSIPLPRQTRRRRRRQSGMQPQLQQNQNQKQPVAASAVNVIVASDAGKPIFARFGTSTEIARICGHLQALRCSILYDVHLGSGKNNPLGDLQCIQSSNGSMLVFMHVESIWLVAIAKTTNKTSSSSSTITQAYLRLLLEHVYSQLIFHLTNHVQAMFQQNASLDLQSILLQGGTGTSSSSSIHGLMHSLLNQADVFISTTTRKRSDDCDTIDNDDEEEEEQHEHEHEVVTSDDGDKEPNDNDDDMANSHHHNNNNPAPFLSSSILILFPLSNHVREKTSKFLQTIGQEETQHCVFSILFTTTNTTTTVTANNNNNNPRTPCDCDCKLLTCVQSSFRPHQLRTTDLNLLMHFCSQQLENNSNHNSSNNQGASSTSAAAAASAELWLPVCLPRFHASGFLYCYTTRLEMTESSSSNKNHHLTLALLSQMGSTEQFQLFRTAATRIRHELGLPMPKESPILTILSSTSSCPNNANTTTDQANEIQQQTFLNNHNNDSDDIAWRRQSFDNHEDEDVNRSRHEDDNDREFRNDNDVCHHDEHNNDEDYVDASGDGNGIIPYVGITDQHSSSSLGGQVVSTFCTEVQCAMDHMYVQDFVTKEYLRDLIITKSSNSSSSSSNNMFVRHFLFRFNAPIRIMSSGVNTNNNSNSRRHFRLWNNTNIHYRRNNSSATSSTNSTNSSSTTATTTTIGHLTQCISSWLGNTDNNHDDDDDDFIHLQNKIWSHYQKLNLRLRLGSASFESVLGAWDMITANDSTASTADTGDTSSSTENNNNNYYYESTSPGIGCHCPAMGLLESPPNFINGLTYVVDGTETYLGMSGQDFELFVVLSSSSSSTICNSTNTSTSSDNHHYHHAEKGKHSSRSIPVQQGAALAARLARRLLLDQDKLFIAKPFTWKQS